MFNLFGKRTSKGNVELTRKRFELWMRVEMPGVFVNQTVARCVDEIEAYTQEEADAIARKYGCWAELTMK